MPSRLRRRSLPFLSDAPLMAFYSRLTLLAERVLLAACAVLFGVLSLTVFYQVIARNLLGGGGLWTFEMAQLTVSWCVFLGAAVAVRRGVHYVVDVLPAEYRVANAILKLFSSAAITLFALVMFIHGLDFLTVGGRIGLNTLPWTLYWNYLPIVLSGFFMLVFMVEIWIRDLKAFDRPSRSPGA